MVHSSGLVVTKLVFYPDNPSSNPAVRKDINKLITGRGWPILKKGLGHFASGSKIAPYLGKSAQSPLRSATHCPKLLAEYLLGFRTT